MLGVAMRMFFGRGDESPENESGECRWLFCGAAGLGVGVLTGFLGVGGGFLIVPALTLLGRLPMRRAIATSLVVISCNSAAGLVGHLRRTDFDWRIAGMFLRSRSSACWPAGDLPSAWSRAGCAHGSDGSSSRLRLLSSSKTAPVFAR